MMRLEDGQSQVEESPKLRSNEVREQINSEVNSEQRLEQNDLEQSCSLEEWMNYEIQLV